MAGFFLSGWEDLASPVSCRLCGWCRACHTTVLDWINLIFFSAALECWCLTPSSCLDCSLPAVRAHLHFRAAVWLFSILVPAGPLCSLWCSCDRQGKVGRLGSGRTPCFSAWGQQGKEQLSLTGSWCWGWEVDFCPLLSVFQLKSERLVLGSELFVFKLEREMP